MNATITFITDTLAPLGTSVINEIASTAMEHPPVAASVATVAVLAFALYYMCGSSGNTADRKIVQSTADKIQNLKPRIGDADAYDFSEKYGKPTYCEGTKAGSLAMGAALGRSLFGEGEFSTSESVKPSELRRRGATGYGSKLKDVVELGNQLIKKKSGQCDHMAAAVIADVTNQVRDTGANWNSHVELVGNGAHAFVVIGRNQRGDINRPNTWGSNAMLVDSWLAAVGINDNYKNSLTVGNNGVITSRAGIRLNMDAFGPVTINGSFSPAEIRGK